MNVSIIGSGNVATHVAKRLHARGCRVLQICSTTPAHVQVLAQQVKAQAVNALADLLPADVYIISVTDAAIAGVAAALNAGNALVVHTSGSTNNLVLDKFSRFGVLYPLQTFSLSRPEMDWEQVPVFVEANTHEALDAVKQLALLLSHNVREADSAQRLQLHTAAVFACNFVNYLLSAAADLAGNHFQTLYPLVRETIEKAFAAHHPRDVQTGPAIRNDAATMEKQLATLPQELREVYLQLSALIMNA